jgi:hypothetical protein
MPWLRSTDFMLRSSEVPADNDVLQVDQQKSSPRHQEKNL